MDAIQRKVQVMSQELRNALERCSVCEHQVQDIREKAEKETKALLSKIEALKSDLDQTKMELAKVCLELENNKKALKGPTVGTSVTHKEKPDDKQNEFIVFFDLRTAGLDRQACEILQIAARAGNSSYAAYIAPTRGIEPAAALVNGFQFQGGVLRLHGERVRTESIQSALEGLISFLKKQGSPVLLAAHGGKTFDFPVILRVMQQYKMANQFLANCKFFVDTIDVFREKFPDLQSYSQSRLAEKYNLPASRNAAGKVEALQALVTKCNVSHADLLWHTFNPMH